MKTKIIIDKKLTEQEVVEHCLNMKYSGGNMNYVNFFLGIYLLCSQSPNALYYLAMLNKHII